MSEISLNPIQVPYQNTTHSLVGGIDSQSNISTIGNQANGDSISYDPAVKTAHSGTQAALIANIGSEILTRYGNGSATVQDQKGGVLSIANGDDGKKHVFGIKPNTTERVDLGELSDPKTKSKALSGGFIASGAQGEKEFTDLTQVSQNGLEAAGSVQQHESEFGVHNIAGLQSTFDLLRQSSNLQKTTADLTKVLGPADPLAAAQEQSEATRNLIASFTNPNA